MSQTRSLPWLRPALLLLVLAGTFALLALLARPAAAQSVENACDSEGQIACIPLPEGEAGDPAARAAAPPDSSIAASPPVRPCLPAARSVDEGPAIALPRAPLPPAPLPCGTRDVITTVNQANLLYARALRTTTTGELPSVWRGEALTQLQGYVALLRDSGRYATPSLLSINVTDLRVAADRARVVTTEHWLYEERTRLTGTLLVHDVQWVENLYELRLSAGRWYVTRNDVRSLDGPPPPPMPIPVPGPLTVSTDRSDYWTGETITASITNGTGSVLTGGGGYACGLVQVERLGPLEWEKADGGAQVCTLIATLLRPGETRTERLPAPPVPGTYRLSVRVSAEDGRPVTAYSAQFDVR